MTHRWWFAALAASGIFAGHMTFDAFILIGYVGVGCYALTAWVIAATSFGVVAWRMRARNILRWWHVVLVFAIGGFVVCGPRWRDVANMHTRTGVPRDKSEGGHKPVTVKDF